MGGPYQRGSTKYLIHVAKFLNIVEGQAEAGRLAS